MVKKSNKKNKNPKNNDDNCFQYALTVALNHKQIKTHPERISKNKPFIDQHNWKEIDFPSHSGKYLFIRFPDWKTFEQNNQTITLIILFDRTTLKR